MQEKIHSLIQVVTVGTSSTDVAMPSETRQTLIFSPHATATYSVSNAPQAAVGDGLVITPSGGALVLRRADIGDIICQRWQAIAAASIGVPVLQAFVERPTTAPSLIEDADFKAQRVS